MDRDVLFLIIIHACIYFFNLASYTLKKNHVDFACVDCYIVVVLVEILYSNYY